jgi:HD-like signal output (HDOD) protein
VVDDQPSALRAVVLLMESLGPGWEVRGFDSPAEVLVALKAQEPDLVLTDFSMPDMMGSELLEVVREAAPNAVRMVMSGWVDINKLSGITSAHQYFTKPFDALRLKEVVRRTFAARETLHDDALRQLVVSLRSLPSLPHVYHTLLAKLADEDGSSEAIAGLVAQDAGLSSKLLHLANSPLFGRGNQVSDPFEAVLCLGTELIKAVVLSQELFKHYSGLKHTEIEIPRLWSHSWDVAELAQYIGLQTSGTRSLSEAAFLAGLLHEVGIVILIDNFPQPFQTACGAARKNRSPLTPELLRTFSAAAPQVGAYLLELWGLPANVISAVAYHEHPEQDGAAEFPLSAVLYTADQICLRKSPPHPFAVPEWNVDYLKGIGWWERVPAWQKA